ncbi:YihY family inner membrane protein [Alcanivorax quisquiliarum]|uniref:UPF0761 membrane protein MU846_11385 n=1 Tax=Alcanivorax quisquiliarum TaxID=2933565 RepID=A0ABT0E8Z8_9GAMM|nr:YihY family inner membrane protein [Alcanivorax quisquiliarum]MCK0538313.1 YihY family inner membrane protein [Alcanivorax quisquiliarum]
MDSTTWHIMRQHLVNAGGTVRDFLGLLGRQFRDDGCRESAAALTYTTLFAIVPVLTVTYSVLAMVPALKERGSVFQDWLLEYFVPSAGNQVQDYLHEFSRQTTNLTLIGGLVLVITAVLLLRTIEHTMNRIWKVAAPRKGLVSLLMYWAVLTLGPLLLGAGLGVTSYLTSVSLVSDTVAYFGGMRLWLALLPVLFTTSLLTLLYVVVPNCHVPFRQGLVGGFVAAVVFEVAKSGFTLFIRHAPNYEVVYGAFAAVPIFLLWLYISWVVVLLGAELVRTLTIFGEYRRNVPRLQALLRVLEVLWRKQQQGRVLRPAQLRRTLIAAGAARWDEYRNLLLDLELVRRTEEGGYVLTRDLRTLTLSELLDMTPWPAESQLRVMAPLRRPWETDLQARCTEAQENMRRPLSLSLETLFNAPGDADPSADASRAAEAPVVVRAGNTASEGSAARENSAASDNSAASEESTESTNTAGRARKVSV